MTIKMKDLFELPMSCSRNDGEMSLSDSNYHLASFCDVLTYEDGKGLFRADAAAVAINAYDANQERIAKLRGSIANLAQDGVELNEKNIAQQQEIAELKKRIVMLDEQVLSFTNPGEYANSFIKRTGRGMK